MIPNAATIWGLLLLGAVTASISLTLAYSALFKWLRQFVSPNAFFRELFSCPYCLSHWVAFLLLLVFPMRPISTGTAALDLFLATIVVVVVAAPFAWIVFNAYAKE